MWHGEDNRTTLENKNQCDWLATYGTRNNRRGHLESGLPEVLLGLVEKTGKRIFGPMARPSGRQTSKRAPNFPWYLLLCVLSLPLVFRLNLGTCFSGAKYDKSTGISLPCLGYKRLISTFSLDAPFLFSLLHSRFECFDKVGCCAGEAHLARNWGGLLDNILQRSETPSPMPVRNC